MDVRLPPGAPLHHKVNGGGVRSPRPSEEALRALSQEEQECLQFFEDTIESLEDSLEEDERRGGGRGAGPRPAAATPPEARASTPKNQDIIDLVHPEPDLVPTRETFNPSNPDFQSLVSTPDSHFEIKPRRDPAEGLPSEYNPPLPSGSYGPSDSGTPYHPPGCIPTPVLIAHQIAENQAGGTSGFNPSSLLRRRSLDSEKPVGGAGDAPSRVAPPPSAKPTRFPANISVIHGSKELHSQPLPSVNVHERQAQMLANLSGGSHPLEEPPPPPPPTQLPPPPQPRNTPTRSVSFRDPTPDKSRMEALSKLGLTRSRASSGGGAPPAPLSSSPDPLPAAEAGAKPPESGSPPATGRRPQRSEPPHGREDRKSESLLRSESLKSHEVRDPPQRPPPSPPLDDCDFPPPPPEVVSPEFNSYGGKSMVVQPPRAEPPSPPSSPEPRAPPVLAAPSEFNSYGGKTKVMTPAPPAVTRSNLPDILSSHIKSQAPPTRPEPLPTELNSYGGRSRTFNPSASVHRPSESAAKTLRAPAPAPAPKPARHSYHGAMQRPAPRAPSPEHRRRPASMFRPQSITVQFSGRGATDESRREALRKLGLLKDS